MPFKLSLPNPLAEDLRIAVLGASRSGKTVFLTALLDHLRNHLPERFTLQAAALARREAVRITGYAEEALPPPPDTFPYAAFRGALVEEGSWPEKTRDTYQYRLKVLRDDGPLGASRSVRLTFLDFPGERIADAPVASLSYAAWSDFVLGNLPAGAEFEPLVAGYHAAAADPGSSADAVVDAYKALLARRLKSFHTAITPSTFALCPRGSAAPADAPGEQLVRERFTGLNAGQQFAPLSAGVREARAGLAAQFASAYHAYQDQLIRPLYARLAQADRLCLLVNIPEILQSGPAAYNDHADLLQHVLAYCCPRRGWLRGVADWILYQGSKLFIDARFRPGQIGKVAFVATQADRVCTSDTNRLLRLLTELQRNILRGLPHVGIPIAPFTCAAVRATQAGKDDGTLRGRLMGQGTGSQDERPPSEFSVSRLPDQWPADWHRGDFKFPKVLPRFSQNKHHPPPQAGLDRIFNFLCS